MKVVIVNHILLWIFCTEWMVVLGAKSRKIFNSNLTIIATVTSYLGDREGAWGWGYTCSYRALNLNMKQKGYLKIPERLICFLVKLIIDSSHKIGIKYAWHRARHLPEEYFFLVGIGPEWICRGNHCVYTNVKLSAKQGVFCVCVGGGGGL